MGKRKITVHVRDLDRRFRCALPREGCGHVVVLAVKCPRCGADPFLVAGAGKRPSADDRAWEADAGCLACGARVGTLRVEADTLFGVREDEAVLRGPWRVY